MIWKRSTFNFYRVHSDKPSKIWKIYKLNHSSMDHLYIRCASIASGIGLLCMDLNLQEIKTDLCSFIYILYHMSALETEINYYLKIAIDVNKKIGGKRGYEAQADSKDKFLIQKDNISKQMHYIKAKLQQRERKTGAQVLGINMQIKQKIENINNQLERMTQSINNDKNASETAKVIKQKIVNQFKERAKRLQQMIQGPGDLKKLMGTAGKNNQTLTEATDLLLDHEGRSKNTYRVRKNNNNKDNKPTQMQLQAMQRWKKNDEAIDERLDDLTQRTLEWKKKVKQTGQLIDESDKKIDDLTTEVDKVNQNLLRSNKQLKGIIQQYRKPHKFCIDIVLILLLIGLLVGIIKVSQK